RLGSCRHDPSLQLCCLRSGPRRRLSMVLASIWFPRSRRAPRLALAVLAAAFITTALDAPAVPCDVLLNEILAGPPRDWNGDGTVSSRDDEWVEIVNLGATAADLSGYLLSDADSTMRFAFTGLLEAGGHQVIYGLQAVEWQRGNGRAISGLSLNNSG